MNYNLAEPIYDHSRENPGRPAIGYEGREISYGELAQRAANIAAALVQSPDWKSRANGSLPRVAILASRTADACAAMLGACWSGATYIPIGLKSPEDRLISIILQCSPVAIIADENGSKLLTEKVIAACPAFIIAVGSKLPARASVPAIAIHELRQLPSVAVTRPAPVAATDVAYIIFTSGTTGMPKGVEISARAVKNFAQGMVERLAYTPDDRILDVFELSFDASVFTMFPIWKAGGSLHILPPNRIMNAVKFAKENKLTIWSSVPSLISLMKEIKALAPGVLPALRLTVFGGEQLTTSIVKLWQQTAPNSIIENHYGPTEATVACFGQRVDPTAITTARHDVIAIGQVFPGCNATILTDSGESAPAGVQGELAISGIQLAERYLNAPEQTAAKFPLINGVRWYKTGDLAVCDANGTFYHVGRVDNQVKILGNRVELEEIETHLRAATQTNQVAALPWPMVGTSAQGLVAFVANQTANGDEVINKLKSHLPAYMIPSRIVVIPEMPLNQNGKVDRAALIRILEQGQESEKAN